jgi:hypothetical protein
MPDSREAILLTVEADPIFKEQMAAINADLNAVAG